LINNKPSKSKQARIEKFDESDKTDHMRMRFFAVATPLPKQTPTPDEEEAIQHEKLSAASSSSSDNVDTASMSHDSNVLVDAGVPLPEFCSKQANSLKNLLLSPLEPDQYC